MVAPETLGTQRFSRRFPPSEPEQRISDLDLGRNWAEPMKTAYSKRLRCRCSLHAAHALSRRDRKMR